MRYIGPFLRMNSLTREQIQKQLFFLSKESVKFLALHSRCGIAIPAKELKGKNTPNFDISTINSISPLLCLYKKANPKLINIGGNLSFDQESVKREINIEGNALMTLSLLELIDYYKNFKDIDNKKYSLSNLYLFLAKRQLEFYASNLRSLEGVFIDKKDVSKDEDTEVKLEEKNKKFKYSDQAFLMAAYYKYSLYDDGKTAEEYKNFALDILNMFLNYREELYFCSREELTKLCLAFNIFYKDSNRDDAKLVLFDLMEYLYEDHGLELNLEQDSQEDLEIMCLEFINCMLLYHNTGILKFKEIGENLYSKLIELYEPEKGIFIKATEKKEISYSCVELALYLLCVITHIRFSGIRRDENMIVIDVFKRQIIDSGIILSWPNSPDLDDVERYRNFSSKSEDLLDEQEFRMVALPTPEAVEAPPIFIKSVTYKKKKEAFSQGKESFDSGKNMFIFFLITYLDKLLKDYTIEEVEE